jgi:hypothetical protein
MNTQKIDLDISKPDAIAQTVTIGQGDKGGTTIEAHVYDGGGAVDLSGKTAMLEVRLPDGKSYVRDAHCTVSGNKITYTVDEEHVGAIAGITDEAYFDILDGPTVIYSTNRFRLRILKSARTDAKPAESWDTEVDAMIARGDAAIAASQQATSNATTATATATTAAANANAAASATANVVAEAVEALSHETGTEAAQINVLAIEVADLKQDYVVVSEALYAPSSKMTVSGEAVTPSSATVSGEKVTLS